MDKLSDFIPLIVILASVIFSIVKGTGKKEREKTAKTTLPGRNTEPRPMDTAFPRPVENRPVRQVNNSSLELDKKIKQTKKELERIKMMQSNLPPKPQIRTSSQTSPHFMSAHDAIETPFLDVSNFDEIKKAVIYSEIFNRKEY